jgi:hypothetical protein
MASLAGKVGRRRRPKLLAGTGKDQRTCWSSPTPTRACAARSTPTSSRPPSQGAELIAAGKTVLFYLVGRKGRAVIRRDYPKARSPSSTPPVREARLCRGRSASRRAAGACTRRQVRRRAPVLREVQVRAGAGPDRAADHPGSRSHAAAAAASARSNTSRTRSDPRRAAAALSEDPAVRRAAGNARPPNRARR